MNNESKRHYLYLFLSILSGSILFLSFPKWDLWALIWFGLVPIFYVSLKAKNKTEAFRYGFFTGLTFFIGTQYWIYHSMNHYGNIAFIPSILIVILLCTYQSLYIGLFSLLINKVKLPLYLTAPIFWCSMEYLREILLTGFPWSFLGHSQYKNISLIQIADITGVYGISFLIVMANAVIYHLLFTKVWRHTSLNRHLIPIVAFLLLFTGTIFYGIERVKGCAHTPSQDREVCLHTTVKIGIIQANIEQHMKWDKNFSQTVFEKYENLTKELVKKANPELVVWPETALPFVFNANPDMADRLLAFKKELPSSLLFGSVLVKDYINGKYILSNSALFYGSAPPHLDGSALTHLYSASNKPDYIYDKIHLVPFGEYIPLKNSLLFFLDKLVNAIGDFAPGSDYTVATTPNFSFSTHICYEIIFSDLVRKCVGAPPSKCVGAPPSKCVGAPPCNKDVDFIITITNDAWFGDTAGPYQHFAISVFRAVENKKPLIRAANTGISGFISATGFIERKTNLFETATLTHNVQKHKAYTFYTKYGNIFVYLCNTLSIIIILFFRRKINDNSARVKRKGETSN